MENKLAMLPVPQRWRDTLHKIMSLAGVATGSLTTYQEATQLVEGDVVLAALLTIIFQGGMYITARLAEESSRAKHRTITIVLCLTWTLLAIFPAYASGLDIFDTLDSFLKDILPLLLNHVSQAKKRRAENVLGAPPSEYNF
jgi:glucan phosphoethanolaminetransferase (alkaline phosphatase superfamily)